jgi:hypothetical protein
MSDPVFSRRDVERFSPDGSPRCYMLAPLTFRERQAFRADMARQGGLFPTRSQLAEALRASVRELAPADIADTLSVIDTAEAEPDNADAQARLGAVEAACAAVPIYAALLAARQRYIGMQPWVAAAHALRGWDGPGLPAFRRERGIVPDDLLDQLPLDELDALGWRAVALMQPSPSAEGNSAAPSPSPETPAPTTAG